MNQTEREALINFKDPTFSRLILTLNRSSASWWKTLNTDCWLSPILSSFMMIRINHFCSWADILRNMCIKSLRVYKRYLRKLYFPPKSLNYFSKIRNKIWPLNLDQIKHIKVLTCQCFFCVIFINILQTVYDEYFNLVYMVISYKINKLKLFFSRYYAI